MTFNEIRVLLQALVEEARVATLPVAERQRVSRRTRIKKHFPSPAAVEYLASHPGATIADMQAAGIFKKDAKRAKRHVGPQAPKVAASEAYLKDHPLASNHEVAAHVGCCLETVIRAKHQLGTVRVYPPRKAKNGIQGSP